MYTDAQSAIFLAFNKHDLFILNVSGKGTNNFVGEN